MAQNDYSLLASLAPKAAQNEQGPDTGSDYASQARVHWRALLGQESGGKQFRPDGSVVTSNKGAKGIAQIMESTAPEAARLAGLPYDKTRLITDPEYNEALGFAYFTEKMREFGGDPSKALAAYNAGSGRVRGALKKAQEAGKPDAWLDFMPDETRKYVPSILSRSAPRGRQEAGDRFTSVKPMATDRTMSEAVTDNLIGLGAGGVTGVEMIFNAFGADNAASKTLREARDGLMSNQSDYRKDQRRERAARIEAAENSGSTWAEIVANAEGFFEAPLETSLNAVGTSAPTILAGLIPGVNKVVAARLILQSAIGAAQGAGSVKGTIYETVERKLIEAGHTPDDAAKVAAGAQAYDSQNAGNIAVGTILGVLAGSSGIESAAAKRSAGSAAASSAGRAATNSLLKRTAKGVLEESVPEMAQGGQERYAGNVALNNAGFNVDPMQGVAGNAFAEGLAAAPGGGIAGAMSSPRSAAPAPVANPAVEAARQKAAQGNSPLSSAAVAGNDAAPAQQQPEKADADPMADRLGALEAEVRQGGLLNAVRSADSPINPKQLVNDLSIARSPSTAAHLREQALARIEFAVEWARDNAPAKARAVDTGAVVQAIDATLSDAAIQLPERDRATLTDLRSMIAVGSMGAQAKAALAQQAIDLMTPYRAGAIESTANDAPAALFGDKQPDQPQAQAPRQGGALLNGLGKNAIQPTVGTTEQGQNASQEAEARLQQLAEEDGQAGAANGSIKAVPPAAPDVAAAAATESASARLGQLEEEESSNQFEPGMAPAAETAPTAEPAPAPSAEPAFDRIAEPRVAIPADDGSGMTAARRKRRAVLENLAGIGFDRVERRDDGFYFLNPRTRQEFRLDGRADAQMANVAVRRALDAAAQQAATSNQNDTPQPTEAQAKAGKYAKGNLKFDGLDIAIENPVGSTRSGTDPTGNKWSVDMTAHYGFVRRTMGADGDQVDVYIAPNARAGSPVYVFDQHNDDGSFDEHKVVLGVRSQAEAERIYDAHFSDGSGPSRRRGVKAMSMDEFKSWLKSDGTKAPAAVEDIASSVDPVVAPGSIIYSDGERTAVAADESKFPAKAAPQGKAKERYRVSKGQAALLRSIAAAFGKKVAFFTGIRDDGFVLNSKPDTIFINQETGISTLAVLGHELLHLLKTDMPQAYAAIVKVIRSRVANAKAFREDYYGRFVVVDSDGKPVGAFHRQEDANRALKSIDGKGSIREQSNAELNDNELEELVADLNGNMMRDGKFWHQVFQQIQADGKAPNSLISRFVGLITNVISKISQAFDGEKSFEANKFVNDLKEVRKALSQGMSLYAKSAEISANKLKADAMKAATKVKMSSDRVADESPDVGIHFSKQARDTLDGAKYGTGLKGAEAQRLSDATDPRIKDRVYFYIDEGSGVRPEAGVGGVAHEVKLPKLYDAKADINGIWNASDLNGSESRVLDAGFDGYFVKRHPTGQGLAVVLGKASRGMKATPMPSFSASKPATLVIDEPLKKGLMSQEIAAIDITRIPGAKIKSGTIVVPPQSRQAANDEFERANIAVRFSAERLPTPAEQYAEVEAKYRGTDQWMKAPNGEPTKLNERQWIHVRTPSFKSWFGDWEKFAGMQGGVWNDADGEVSKAVGSNGEPLVVYHGTNTAGFMKFNRPGGSARGDLGIFTTPDWEGAASYVTKGRARNIDAPAMPKTVSDLEDIGYDFYDTDGEFSYSDANGYTYGPFDTEAEALQNALDEYDDSNNIDTRPGVYALFINVRDPAESNFEGANWDGQRAGQYQVVNEDGELIYSEDGRAYFTDEYEANELAEANDGARVESAEDHYETTDGVVRDARLSGNDGAIIRDVMDIGSGPIAPFDPFDIFVAVDPNQLKSADFNDGSYSLDKDDIRLSAERKPAKATTKKREQEAAIGDRTDISKLPNGRAIPPEVAVGALASSFEIARGKTYNRGRDLKIDIQSRVVAAAKAARVSLTARTKELHKFLAGVVFGDAMYALRTNENAIGWYDSKVSRAIGAISVIHPEINTSKESRLAFLWALAVTSNGLKVDKNFEIAEAAYRRWKSSSETLQARVMPTDVGIGNASKAINESLGLFNELTASLGYERTAKFMATEFPAGDITRMLGLEVGGEWASTPVRGAAILGPKIGNGFYMNLNGYFDALTMDRWLMRTYGRMTGTLMTIDKQAISDSRNKLKATIDAMTPAQRREMSSMIGNPVRKGMSQGELDALSVAVDKASIVKEKRAKMQEDEKTNRFRLDARGLAKNLDGQKEAPANPAERNWIRAIFATALERLREEGKGMTMSDLQALLWYPERRLYDAAKSDDSIDEGYEDDDAPDYANAALKLALNNGADRASVIAAMDAAEAMGTVRAETLTDEERAAMMREMRAAPEQQVQAAFEVAPDPANAQAVAAWSGIDAKTRAAITASVRDDVLPGIADAVGVTIKKVAPATGGFAGLINPNLIGEYQKTKVSIRQARQLSAAIGYVLDQDSVALSDPRSDKTVNLIRLTFDKKPDAHVAQIFAAINSAIPEIDAFTLRGKNFDVLNFTSLSNEYVIEQIRQAMVKAGLPLEAVLSHGEVHSELIEKGSYEVHLQGIRPGDREGVRGELDRLRDRARQIVEQGINAARSGRPGAAGLAAEPASKGASFSRDRAGRDRSRELAPLEGAPTVAGATGPDPRLVEVAERYAQQNGISLKRQAEYVQVDPERARRIADAYAAMPHAPGDRKVKEAYDNLIRQTVAQYRALEDAGYKFYFFDESNDPYQGNPWNAMRDLRANQVMGVFATEAGFGSGATDLDVADNPLLADTGIKWPYGSLDGKRKRVLANDLFRAVHDAFGHGLEGSGFRAQGEENAWQAHVRLFTGSAVAAITSETRGQNSFLNYTAIPLWEIVGEHRARLLYDEGYEGRKEGSESGSLSGGDVPSGKGLPGLQQVERDDVPVLQREEPELPSLRGQGNNGGAGASDSSGVSGRNGASANTETPTGPDRQQRQLRAGESSLGNSYGEPEKPAPIKNSDAQRQDASHVSVGGGVGRVDSGSLDAARQVQVDRSGGSGDAAWQGRAPLWKTITVGEHNRRAKVEDTIFADQKTGLMPEWTWTEGRVGDMPAANGQDPEIIKLFDDLQNARGLRLVRAREAVDAHPMGEQIAKIHRDFYDILEQLDDDGLIKINCK